MQFSPAALNPLRSRADLQQFASDLLNPLLGQFTPGHAGVVLGSSQAWYGEPSASLEGFARPLWALAPLAAGGFAFAHWDKWRRGLVNGTNPAHPEFWGWPRDFDQRTVESAALGFAMTLASEYLWTPLSEAEKRQVATWLGKFNEVRAVDNNWQFFQVLVNLGLQRCGCACDESVIERSLQRIDSFHLGKGWYVDGSPGPSGNDGRVGDYYVPMAMQFYALLFAQQRPDSPFAHTFRERAGHFASDFAAWFAADGSAIPFGRSLTYRFAQGAFWGALAFANLEALPWPVIKGLYLRHLRWWAQQPIFSETGFLTIGYGYANLHMAESYNSPASPYWAMKAFLPLALPESHPFWQASEAAPPIAATPLTLPHAKLILQHGAGCSDVTALNPGQPIADWPRHAAGKYSKLAYSTRFGFSVPVGLATLAEGGFDSSLALSDDHGKRFRTREASESPQVRKGVAWSRWHPWPDVSVETWLFPINQGHLRVHHITSARALTSAECGFATGYTRKDEQLVTQSDAHSAWLTSPQGASTIDDLSGDRRPSCVELGVNSNLLHPLAAMPVLQGRHAAGTYWLASRVRGAAVLPLPPENFTFTPGQHGFRFSQGQHLWCEYREGELYFSPDYLRAPDSPETSLV